MRTSTFACCFALSFSVFACASQEPLDIESTDEESAVESTSQALSTTYASLRHGNWSDATMWNPGGVPGVEDVVSIGSAHQVTVDVAAEASSITLVELSAAKMIMNEDLAVSGNMFVGKYCSVDLNDKTLSAGSISMRQGASFPRDPGARLDVTGTLSTYWSAHMALQPQDTVGSLALQRGTGATSATSNVTNSVTVTRDGVASWLQLGAPLVLTGAVNMTESVINDGGYDITAASGYWYSSRVVRQGTGKLDLGSLSLVRTSTLDARAGDVIHGNLASIGISTFARSQLAVNQLAGDMTGLTVDGNLTLDPNADKSKLTLNFDATLGEGLDWALAWKGNRVAQLQTWASASSGQLIVNFPAGITFDPAEHIFYDSATNYTYVGYTHTYCGNGELNGDEQCDDGNTDETDGCLSTCEFPPLPSLVGQWSFEGANPLADSTGHFSSLMLQGNASIIDGQLDVNAVVSGNAANATGWANAVGYTGPTIRAKTLVSWVTMENLSIRSGSALTLDNASGDNFDAIVYAERQPLRWMAGSTNFMRTQDVVTQDETVSGQLVQLAISYRDLGGGQVEVTICRDGEQMGKYTKGNMAQWATGNAEVIFGKRHTNGGTAPGGIDAKIEEARIYAGAIECDQIGSLQPE